jgi:hypothetical protein
MCLAAAAGNLAAGRDLLHTHFTTDQPGWRHGTSPGLRPSRPGKSTQHWPAAARKTRSTRTRRTPARSASSWPPSPSTPAGPGEGSAARIPHPPGGAVATSGPGPASRASRSAAAGASRPAWWSSTTPRPGGSGQIWVIAEALDFPGTVDGVARAAPATGRMPRRAACTPPAWTAANMERTTRGNLGGDGRQTTAHVAAQGARRLRVAADAARPLPSGAPGAGRDGVPRPVTPSRVSGRGAGS